MQNLSLLLLLGVVLLPLLPLQLQALHRSGLHRAHGHPLRQCCTCSSNQHAA
jgi:hypothetical protein